MKIEGRVRRQQKIEHVVRIEREGVGIAGEGLASGRMKVPIRNLAAAKALRGSHLHRIVGEVVAKEEETEMRDRQRGHDEGQRQRHLPLHRNANIECRARRRES